MQILDGKKVRDSIAENIREELKQLKTKPKLVVFQVGEDERSSAYVKQKIIFGEKLGFEVEYIQLPESIDTADLILRINIMNSDREVNGIIVQLPLPKKFDSTKIIEAISPEKDVDGLTAKNLRMIIEGNNSGFVPATTKGILSLLDYYKIQIEGKKVTIVGRSLLVGRPTALMFLNRNATVTICHTKTKKLKDEIRGADIIISATGVPGLIGKLSVKKGQVIIDVGITKVGDRLVGDVDFGPVSKIVKAVSPVPGGVGPMTVVSLFENTLVAYKRQEGII